MNVQLLYKYIPVHPNLSLRLPPTLSLNLTRPSRLTVFLPISRKFLREPALLANSRPLPIEHVYRDQNQEAN